jgi:enoyl-CoA hydratase/carnithine racemase
MLGFDLGKPFVGKGFNDAVTGGGQGCRACATHIIAELREKFGLRSVNALFMGGAFVQTG